MTNELYRLPSRFCANGTYPAPKRLSYSRTALMSLFFGGFLSGCAQTPTFPTEDKVTAGIFLDVGARAYSRPDDLRRISNRGLELTKDSEGFRSYLYNDAARYCTIGYGHLVKLAPCDGKESAEFLSGVTVSEGTELLRSDMEIAERGVTALTTVELTEGQYAALCDFVYNIGSGNYSSSTLRKVINNGELDRAAFQFSRWVKAGGRELEGLKVRRQREVELFYDGLVMPRAVPRSGDDTSPIDIRAGE